MREHLFIYGTLLEDKYNPVADILKSNTRETGEGYIYGRLYDLGEYPAAVKTNKKDEKVFGKILEITHPDILFPVLDEYEIASDQHDNISEYTREKIEVTTCNETTITAWIYLYSGNPQGLQQIHSGKYLQYLEGRES